MITVHGGGAWACAHNTIRTRQTWGKCADRVQKKLNHLAANRFADKALFTPSVLGYPLFTWRSGVV